MVSASLLFAALPALYAAELVLDADTQSLQVGQTIGLRLTVIDAALPGAPSWPTVPGAKIAYQGVQQSVARIYGKTSRTVTYTYALTALDDGEIKIPAMELSVAGESLRTEPLVLKVSPRAATPGGAKAEASLRAGGQPVTSAYVGQVLVYTMSFRTPEQVLDRRFTAPTFDGLVAEQTRDGELREHRTVIDGQDWSVVQVDLPLVASAAGERTITPGVMAVQVPELGRTGRGAARAFANVRNEVYSSESLKLNVRPLPAEGRRDDFSGLVGEFALSARLLSDRVATGDSVTMEITLSGDGTLAGFSLPPVPADAGYRAYDDTPTVEARVREGVFTSAAAFRRAIVPERPGALTIPAVTLQVFNPRTGQYELIQSEPLTLTVTPGEGEATLSTFAADDQRRDVEAQADDIAPLRPRARPDRALFSPRDPLALGLVGLPWLGFFGLLARELAQRARPRVDPRRALARRLQGAEQAEIGELLGLFREASGLALGRPAPSLDVEALGALPDKHRDEALRLYADLEAARYGGGADAGLRERTLRLCRALLEQG
ncbi:BatD family protein [Myxococcota bacterium]|nr:BatD family protein [Myxococcota bacterium]